MTAVTCDTITRDIIENGYTYSEYTDLIENLLKNDRTTGENHSEMMLHYTKMNLHRMKRINRRMELNPDLDRRLAEIERSMIWLILTEAWCGDAAQSLPVIQKIADQSDKIKTRYILRDEHPEIMDQFLTNGRSRSIPKLICLDFNSLEVLGTWGPRSTDAQLVVESANQIEGIPYQEVAEKLHKWYAEDNTRSIQNELNELLDHWERS